MFYFKWTFLKRKLSCLKTMKWIVTRKNSQEFRVSIPCAAAVWQLLIDLFSVGWGGTFLPCSEREKIDQFICIKGQCKFRNTWGSKKEKELAQRLFSSCTPCVSKQCNINESKPASVYLKGYLQGLWLQSLQWSRSCPTDQNLVVCVCTWVWMEPPLIRQHCSLHKSP